MLYLVEFFDEFHGNFDGYEVESDGFEEVLLEAQADCSEYEWFTISSKEGLLWDGTKIVQ